MTPRQEEIATAYAELGNQQAVARRLGLAQSTVSRALAASKQSERRARERLAMNDPSLEAGMAAAGLTTVPTGAWVKTNEKDDAGRTYSFYVRPERPPEEDPVERMREMFENIPRVHIPSTKVAPSPQKVFIPLTDLHAGAYAWNAETGYGDWDLDKATARLVGWVGRLVDRTPVCEECILFYNGDTLHINGKMPMTPGSGHVLDMDTRFAKVVDATAAAMCVTVDLAAAKHPKVRVVVKRGNHDEDAYLALLMAVKYRYMDVEHVLVEEDPSPYWAHTFGNVFLFGHHGDRVKPQDLVMKMASDHPEIWGRTKHRVVWTGHKHNREMKTFHGATWEQSSCLTDPDAYGAYWGHHALAQAVVYDYERGETDRFTVRP